MNDTVTWTKRTFTDKEVEVASGLSVRSLRSLGSANILQTATLGRGRGRRRTYDHLSLGRAILVGGVNDLGFSLDIAAEIIAFTPLENQLLESFGKEEIIESNSSVLKKKEDDFFIYIVDGTLAFISADNSNSLKKKYSLPFCFGRITEDEEGDFFETWISGIVATPVPRSTRTSNRTKIEVEISYTSNLKKTLPPEIVSYIREQQISRKNMAAAMRRFENPLYFNSLNLSMALRVGKARLQGIELEL